MKKLLLLSTLLVLSSSLCKAQTNNTYASASTGGAYGYGTILKGDSNGTNFTVVHSFNSADGSYPIGKMAQANNGAIYCVTELGGFDDSCTCGKYDPSTGTYTMIYQFFLDITKGGVPYAGVITATNGLIYGTTTSGGSNYDSVAGIYGGGVIFTIDPATDAYTVVYNFTGGTGMGPSSELLQASDGKLYGLQCANSDSNYNAFLFSFDPGNNKFTQLQNLNVTSGMANYGYRPSLVQGPDNKLYGVFADSSDGFTTGILFSYDITNAQYTLHYTFTAADGIPQGGIAVANGNVYCETYGGQNSNGAIYSFNISTGTISTLTTLNNANIGFDPMGGLTLSGNVLTGSCFGGGANGAGTLFSLDLGTNQLTDIFDFDAATTGSGPVCTILNAKAQPTGIKPVSTVEPAIYPNPATDNLLIKNATPNTLYTITNVLGQVVDKGILTGSPQQINLQQLTAGVYLFNNVRFVKQ